MIIITVLTSLLAPDILPVAMVRQVSWEMES